jgi:protease-4
MNIFSFRNIITNNFWFLDPQIALTYQPLIRRIIAGEDIPMPELQPRIEPCAASPNINQAASEPTQPEMVAVIPLMGEMTADGGLCNYGTREIADMIRGAIADEKTSSIVLHIKSGGGAADSVKHLTDVILNSPKPIVAFVESAMSAAYFVAAACRTIVAFDEYSMIGSIGVMISFADMQPVYEAQGVKFHEVYPPESQDKNLAFRNALKGDYELITSDMLSPLAQWFQNSVKQYRSGKLDESIPGLLTGKTFFAKEVMPSLVDEIGNIDRAVNLAHAISIADKFIKK